MLSCHALHYNNMKCYKGNMPMIVKKKIRCYKETTSTLHMKTEEPSSYQIHLMVHMTFTQTDKGTGRKNCHS